MVDRGGNVIQLIGIQKDVDLRLREKFVIRKSEYKDKLLNLLRFFQEGVIISTCNRTEIYFTDDKFSDENLNKVFEALGWSGELKQYVFYREEEKAIKHLMELACGFHSKILGEDQILGQIKNAYNESININEYKGPLQRIFQLAITCGKEFRTVAKLYEIPVSSASIAANKAIAQGIKDFMVIGYGDVGQLAVKYLLSHNIEKVYLVVRNPQTIIAVIDPRVEVVAFSKKSELLSKVSCVISCTSAPHIVLKEQDIDQAVKNNETIERYYIFDLAMPRDVEENIGDLEKVELYNIDRISSLDDENKKLRKERMKEFRWIINKYLEQFENWKNLREIAPVIKEIKTSAEKVCKERILTYSNKCREDNHKELAERMIKSVSDYYTNRAIEVLKEEKLMGSEDQCLKIIERIFINP